MRKTVQWILATVIGSILFALGFDLFLVNHELNSGGVSGLSMILVELTGFGSVGMVTILINLPLFLLGGVKIGKRFFAGSLLGMLTSSLAIDFFARIPAPETEPLLAVLYGGVICGLGLGIVFISGTSTGGSDILVRLLKLKFRNVPIGQINTAFDLLVSLLTGIVFHDITKALYTGITVYISGKVIDAVIYRFDDSRVALIISDFSEEIASKISEKLDRGATFLYGEGAYTGNQKRVIMTAIKRLQLADLTELVTEIDKDAFIIVQDAHQVLGDGFKRYSKTNI